MLYAYYFLKLCGKMFYNVCICKESYNHCYAIMFLNKFTLYHRKISIMCLDNILLLIFKKIDDCEYKSVSNLKNPGI